ncbi:hypothetical protein KTAU_40680 [Thermogemmatispora aurantia]|nr:hypothetical protein KTAU_40680 [Thermogemmatispora aurantia]
MKEARVSIERAEAADEHYHGSEQQRQADGQQRQHEREPPAPQPPEAEARTCHNTHHSHSQLLPRSERGKQEVRVATREKRNASPPCPLTLRLTLEEHRNDSKEWGPLPAWLTYPGSPTW